MRLRNKVDRRAFLEATARAAVTGGLAGVVPVESLAGVGVPPEPASTLLGVLPFLGEGSFPLERTVGAGLGKRRGLDLATLSPAEPVTPSDRFFIRTGCPVRLPEAASWRVRVHGLVGRPEEVALDQLREQVVDQGVHLLECAGNSKAAHFGFLSAARWAGAPLWPLLERARPDPRATQVLVSGWDEHDVQDPGSVPGASWIFPLERLRDAGAFLATSMNGAPLAPDHGYPLRLVVPGWYGCTAIKWVNEIALVDSSAPATEHMREYAGRTHQVFRTAGTPLAKDFEPATIDPAAAAVRVEKLRDREGRIFYRIVGVLWGGTGHGVLRIRTRPGQDATPVEPIAAAAQGPVTFWSHTFRPQAPGRYPIALELTGAGARTRRLDLGFYSREIEIGAD